jgi:hypothetical protein
MAEHFADGLVGMPELEDALFPGYAFEGSLCPK